MSAYLYEITINKYDENNTVEIVHVAAENYLQAAHIAEYYIFYKNKYPSKAIEIVKIERKMEVKDILNSTYNEIEVDEPSPNNYAWPFKAKEDKDEKDEDG